MSKGLTLLARHDGGARSRSMATLFPPAASSGRSPLLCSTSRFAMMVIIHGHNKDSKLTIHLCRTHLYLQCTQNLSLSPYRYHWPSYALLTPKSFYATCTNNNAPLVDKECAGFCDKGDVPSALHCFTDCCVGWNAGLLDGRIHEQHHQEHSREGG